MVTRISNDYRPQLPVVGKDIPRPAVPCHVGTARLLETVNNRTRSVGCAVSLPYSDSDESDNDVLYTDDHDSTSVQHVSLRNKWMTPTAVDSCGERCAQLDDFNWFLPADERTGDLPAPESEIEVSDSFGLVCWSLTSLCHSNGHIETMPAREINPFTALTRIRSQFLRTQ